MVNFTVNTPHHYLMQVVANWGDQLKENQVEALKLKADIECNEAAFVYPTTFHAQCVLMKMLAVHAHVMSNNAPRDPVVMAQTDVIARLTKTLYGGAKVIYDSKGSTFDLQRYGLFWKAEKNLLLGLELCTIGDQRRLEASINHRANPTTQLGTLVSLDLDRKVVSTKGVIEKSFDNETTLKGRVDNLGLFDLSLTGSLSPTLKATFSTGGSVSSFINSGPSSSTYAGISLNFEPI